MKMRTALKISIGFNVLLAVCLCFILAKGWSETTNRPAQLPVPASPMPTNTSPKPFRWSQIESTNYLTFIENLRQIGCPAQTIRDIVTADVESLYRVRAERLRQQWAATQNQSQPSLDAALQQLATEKNSVIARLLGPDANPLPAVDSVAATGQKQPVDSAVTTPLVWQNVDVSKLNLEESQMQAIAELRQNFLDKIGGDSQDPNDPAYRERWQKAQPQADDALAGMIGRKAFLEYGVAATPSQNPPSTH